MKIYLRRFPGEAITLITTQPAAAASIASVAAADHRLAGHSGSPTERAALLYVIELMYGCMVQPVDWRRFAYEDHKVYEAVATCVKDNLGPFVFMPNTDETERMIRDCMSVALGDLQSIADVKSVACRLDEYCRTVEVIYATKNGAAHQVDIQQAAT
jgi:hypothetical protein